MMVREQATLIVSWRSEHSAHPGDLEVPRETENDRNVGLRQDEFPARCYYRGSQA
jgi:hypothetical protein